MVFFIEFKERMNMKSNIVYISKDVMGGTPVFPKTRVPVKTLIDYIESGETVNDFLLDFPSVSRKQIISVLDYMKKKVFVS